MKVKCTNFIQINKRSRFFFSQSNKSILIVMEEGWEGVGVP
jgi:hypothetical protein